MQENIVAQTKRPGPSTAFIVLLLGQLISLTGSGLTTFALGVWVFQLTKSTTLFTLIAFFALIPGIVLSPIAGVVADRFNRRLTMFLSNLIAAIVSAAVFLLLISHTFTMVYLYISVFALAILSTLLRPTFNASITLLVPSEMLGKANGLVQLVQATSQTVAPLIAGILVLGIGIQGIILCDLISYLFACLTLLCIAIPQPKVTLAEKQKVLSSSQLFYGWTYLSQRSGLLGVLIFSSLCSFLLGMAGALLAPLVLSFTSAAALGTIQFVGGCGMFVGAIGMSIWGGPKRQIYAVLGFILTSGIFMSLVGLQDLVWLIAVAAFGVFFCLPIINGAIAAILQSKVAPEVQGRVFAFAQMITGIVTPFAYLLAGPLADKVFNPLLVKNGALANTVGRIIGVGPGRGIGLIFIAISLLLIIMSLVGWLHPRIRRVELELSDHRGVDVADAPVALATSPDRDQVSVQ